MSNSGRVLALRRTIVYFLYRACIYLPQKWLKRKHLQRPQETSRCSVAQDCPRHQASRLIAIPTDSGKIRRLSNTQALRLIRLTPARSTIFGAPGAGNYGAHTPMQLISRCESFREKKSTTLITQNIDGLLQRAGCTEVIELHGSMARSRCGQCGRSRWSLFDRCLNCLGHMRPEVILFGEELPKEALSNAFESAQHCDLFLLIGSTAVVAPAAELPVLALRAGAKLIVIDTEPPLLAHAADVVLTGPAEVLLPELILPI